MTKTKKRLKFWYEQMYMISKTSIKTTV